MDPSPGKKPFNWTKSATIATWLFGILGVISSVVSWLQTKSVSDNGNLKHPDGNEVVRYAVPKVESPKEQTGKPDVKKPIEGANLEPPNSLKPIVLIDESIDIGDYEIKDIDSIFTYEGTKVRVLYIVKGILDVAIPKKTKKIYINFLDGKQITHEVRAQN